MYTTTDRRQKSLRVGPQSWASAEQAQSLHFAGSPLCRAAFLKMVIFVDTVSGTNESIILRNACQKGREQTGPSVPVNQVDNGVAPFRNDRGLNEEKENYTHTHTQNYLLKGEKSRERDEEVRWWNERQVASLEIIKYSCFGLIRKKSQTEDKGKMECF